MQIEVMETEIQPPHFHLSPIIMDVKFWLVWSMSVSHYRPGLSYVGD